MQNPSNSLLNSSHSHGLAILRDLSDRESTLPRSCSYLDTQWTTVSSYVTAQSLDHVALEWFEDHRTEARPVYLFIYLFHLYALSEWPQVKAEGEYSRGHATARQEPRLTGVCGPATRSGLAACLLNNAQEQVPRTLNQLASGGGISSRNYSL